MNVVRCSKCATPIPDTLLQGVPAFPCPKCEAPLELLVFPAIHRQIQAGVVAENAVVEGETTCFFHAEKKAVVVCGGCGRFLCALCDISIDEVHLCPKCVEAGRNKKTLTKFENYRMIFPNLALTVAILPVVIWPLTLVTAPAAIFLVIYGWNKPWSITGRRRIGASVLAILIALTQCLAWLAGFFGWYEIIITRPFD